MTGSTGRPRVDVVIPTLNEAHVLVSSVEKLRAFLAENLAWCDWRVVVADNGSSDGTDTIARQLEAKHGDVRAVLLTRRGRGRALRKAWTESDADIVSYMDVDLSTELPAFPKLVAAIHTGGYDVSIGSRLMRGARIERSIKREFISRCYNLMVRLALHTRFSDAQCGFKAVSRRVVREVVPLIRDEAWFFDTELLVLTERFGFRIKDVPVLWIEDNDSRVKIIPTAIEDIRGLLRLRKTLPALLAARGTRGDAAADDPKRSLEPADPPA